MNTNTILNAERLRKVRYIANNVDSTTKLDPYIREAELFDIAPIITTKVYLWLVETNFGTGEAWTYTTLSGKTIIVDKRMYNSILWGGYYESSCTRGISMGIVSACAYYAYSRAILEGNINLTSFGVVGKNTSYSNPVSDISIKWSADKAVKNGAESIRGVVEHLKSLGLIEIHVKSCTSRKIKIIGN